MANNSEAITVAFASDVKLRKRIFDAINETPHYAPLFEDIARYQLVHQQFSVVNGQNIESSEQPLKKRKLEDGAAATGGLKLEQPRTVILEARDISFTLPQRKKLHLSIVQYGTDFQSPNTVFALSGTNPSSNQVEFEYPVENFANAIRVPVPEKAQKQYNYCLIPAQGQTGSHEPMLWTINHGPLKSCQLLSEDIKEVVGADDDLLDKALNAVLGRNGNRLVYPTEVEFASALVESHRKNDKAYHVKAFRGSKDGYLFFLENGIFFGFKKPLSFFPFSEIISVSYTAVLQRTFNLVITAQGMNDAEEQELEFSMLDQADFAGIDAYIKNHQLQDASMAEARRAKQYKVNGAKTQAPEDANEDGQTELQKAEQELEDEEDEMEEDYDPGSDGESEGSGSSDGDDDYDYANKVKGKDLVKDELGSEAEDVEITDDDEAEDEAEDEEDEEDEEEVLQSKPPTTTKPLPPPTIIPESNGPDYDDEDQL